MTALRDEIVALIRQEGPISVARSMELALGHPKHGYYMTRDPFGRSGDFTTAPEISQMFGELIGLWLAEVWSGMGAPERVVLAEAGPGRGTLMADALRAAKALPAFRAALEVHLVEISPVLREAQARTLAAAGVEPVWHDRLEALPQDAPLLLVANEFLDALPLRQFVRDDGVWRERLVGEAGGELIVGLSPIATAGLPDALQRRRAAEGDIFELSSAALDAVALIARRIGAQGGAALFIDYGHAASGFGDTLQAMKAHAFANPLEDPGEADITAHVDFAAMAAAARSASAAAHGPALQGDALLALGIVQRAERLMAAVPAKAASIAAARDRLLDKSRTGMGRLFRMLAIRPAGTPPPAGFA